MAPFGTSILQHMLYQSSSEADFEKSRHIVLQLSSTETTARTQYAELRHAASNGRKQRLRYLPPGLAYDTTKMHFFIISVPHLTQIVSKLPDLFDVVTRGHVPIVRAYEQGLPHFKDRDTSFAELAGDKPVVQQW
eukprot:COSAG02_NODE_5610_length_4190_cov_4.748717_2_plen_135_part_00